MLILISFLENANSILCVRIPYEPQRHSLRNPPLPIRESQGCKSHHQYLEVVGRVGRVGCWNMFLFQE